ncbi:N-acetylmuramoyl-L-alanine amidase-like domain-containing protein [Emticicia sp. SJ17W-69]|uniref:N-acetylmuramoyl-L-alanine amidase-like domain-containing protein n=1 Tax=Emticicia sp. SJ17W-69 TaxID=3421657 RepID=UPI003EBFC312
MKKSFFTVILLIITNVVFAQSADEMIFMQKMKLPKSESKAQTALSIAKSFIGQPYKGGTLEVNTKEQLVCNLRDFDCSTFVESVIAMTLIKYHEKPSYEKFNTQLKNLRYRKGEINGYTSRLHYFREWMIQSEENNIGQDITNLIGGQIQKKELNFMTSHRELYPKLKEDEAYLLIAKTQKHLNDYDFYFIPKAKVSKIESQIHDGDIIAITSTIDGLDYNHEGFAITQNGRLHLLHASYDLKKVIISQEPLADYLNRIKKHSGISVFRLI